MNVTPLRANTVDPSGQRLFPNTAVETRLIVQAVVERAKEGGETLTYAELKEIIGREARPNETGYRYLQSAKRILLRDHGIVLDAEAKVGVRICSNEEKMLVSARDMKRSRRAVVRSRQKLTAVDYDRLSPEKRTEWNARMSVASALELLSSPKAVKKVEKLVGDNLLPTAATLEIFKK